MKLRIIKKDGKYIIQKRIFFLWLSVDHRTYVTFESAERNLLDLGTILYYVINPYDDDI